MSEKNRNVVIVGAGFGGLFAAQRLARVRGMHVTLIDFYNYHTFLPLLYQVASAGLEPEAIAYPLRGIFRRRRNITTVLAECTAVDPDQRIVHTDGLSYAYDYLILAPGSKTAYYGVPGAEEHSYSLKTLEEAIRLRNHLLSCFEMASLMPGNKVPEAMLRIAVVGSGATGVEYAGALAELIRSPLARDFPELMSLNPSVMLVDGQDKPLSAFSDPLRDYTAQRLAAMGVKLRMGSAVAEVTCEGVRLKNGEFVPAHTVVWTAGIRGEDLEQSLTAVPGIHLGRGGRIQVQPTLQLAMHPEIHIVGDLSLPEFQSPPQVAPNAIQQGTHAAENILLMEKGRAPRAFAYHDKGSMVTIGRSSAVVQLGKRSFTGFLAWVVWLFVHLMYLIGFRNRIIVLVNWAWDYFFSERAVRLILPRDKSVTCGCMAQDIPGTEGPKAKTP